MAELKLDLIGLPGGPTQAQIDSGAAGLATLLSVGGALALAVEQVEGTQRNDLRALIQSLLDEGIGYLLQAVNVTDLSINLPPLWSANAYVTLDTGLYNSTGIARIFENKTLASAIGAATIKLAPSSVANQVFEITGKGGVLRGVKIDGNLVAREAAGFASYTHGVYSANRDNVVIERVTVYDYGETAAVAAMLNTCAVVLDSTSALTSDVTGGVIRGVIVLDAARKAPYGLRVRSDIFGHVRSDSFGVSGFLIEDCILQGTTKNALEICGPNVHDGIVRRVTLTDAQGQGGIETDYGAYNILFEDCEVSFPGASGVLVRGFSAFSFRSSDGPGDGLVKEGSGNIARRCKVHDITSAPSVSGLKCFNLISVRDSVLEDFEVYNIRRGIGAANTALVGIYAQTDELGYEYGEVHNISVVRPNIVGVDTGILFTGNSPISGISFNGGQISANRRGYSEPTSTPLSAITFGGGIVLTADTPVALAPGRATPVATFDGVILRGNQITLNSGSTLAQFKNTKFVLPPLGRDALETALPGILTANGNSQDRMPPGDAFLLRGADIVYDAKAEAYKTCLDSLLADGILDKLDVLFVLGAPFQATGLQNTAQARFNATLTGAPTFAAGQGFSGADASNYVGSAYNPFNGGSLFSQNSAFMMAWKALAVTNALTRFGSNNSRLSTNTARSIDWRPNAAAAVTATAGVNFETIWWMRNNPTDFTHGYDGVTVGTAVASASVALTNANFQIGGIGGTTSNGSSLHRAFAAGSYLTVAEKETLRSRVNTLLAALV